MKKLVIKNTKDLDAIKRLIEANTARCESIERMAQAGKDADGDLSLEDIHELLEELQAHREWLAAAEAGISEFLKPAMMMGVAA